MMDYGIRNPNSDIYMRNEYRSPTPPSLVRDDSYGDIYRVNDYNTRSDRYDITCKLTSCCSYFLLLRFIIKQLHLSILISYDRLLS